MKKTDFLSLFLVKKPIIGMIHLKGTTPENVLERAKGEIDLMMSNGIDAVLIENYFGNLSDVENVLKWIGKQRSHLLYGVNLLSSTMPEPLTFSLASYYGAKFIQIDSVAGRLPTTPVNKDEEFNQKLKSLRENFSIPIIGGVRFKYQPVNSGRNEEEDLQIGIERCDAIAVTGEGTGIETDLQKIQAFREVIGDFPLVIAAGLTAENCLSQMEIGDACIVGSYFKNSYQADGEVSVDHIQRFVEKIQILRNNP
ncbi:MAG: membrane biogenesis protein [Candidatus Peribacteria bacterium]|jgi:predicted TIM-barrel enzyme|nr:membrane biogenesis protein [Candidatus Peribacteria bacterium]